MRVAAAERLTELLSHAVKTRSNGIRGQLAGKRDFVVAQAANFPHQKNITIDGAQAIEGFAKCDGQRLCGRKRRVLSHLDRLTPSSIVPHMVQREIPRDAKEPGAAAPFIGLRYRGPCDPQEDLLGQLARVFVTDDAAQIAKHAFSVRSEEDVGVWHLFVKNTGREESSRAESEDPALHAALGARAPLAPLAPLAPRAPLALRAPRAPRAPNKTYFPSSSRRLKSPSFSPML